MSEPNKEPSIPSSALRKLIDGILTTVVELDAFCVDHFPAVYRRFSAGMDRIERVTLLLTLADADELLARLRADYAERFEKHRHLLPTDGSSAVAAARSPISASPAPSQQPAWSLRSQPIAADRPTLTVLLALDANGTLTVRYSIPDTDRMEQAAPLAWESHWSKISLAGHHGVAALRHVCTQSVESELFPWLAGIGDLLFYALFPDPALSERLFQRLFRSPHASPTRDRVRLRILTSDPALLALPWELSSWHGQPLCQTGWSFERVTQDLAEKRAALQAPPRVLVITPRTATGPGAQEHIQDLRSLLGNPEPEFFRVISSRAELLRCIPAFPADLIYFCGRGTMQQGRAALLLENDERLDIDDLPSLLREHLPQVLLLNGGPTPMDPLWLAAPRRLVPEIPVVLVGRGGPYERLEPALGIRYLQRFLIERQDPAVALAQLEPPPLTPIAAARSAFIAYSAYDSFEVRPLLVRRRDPKAHLRLDRTLPRAAVIEQVSRLVRSKARRVEALVAQADAKNLLTQFGWQAVDHIERQALAPIRSINVSFPVERADLHRRLEQDLRLQLDASPEDALSLTLSRHAPKVRGQASTRVLWLDWGVLGGSEGGPSLKKQELEAWLRFCFDTLVRACPPDLRIVSYLAMHVEEAKQRRLRDDMEQYKQNLLSDQFRAFLLPALPRVDHSELVEFLTEPDNSTCPASLATQVARLVYADTDGVYEKTVQHIEWAERHGWGSLLAELSRRHGLAPAPSHDEETY